MKLETSRRMLAGALLEAFFVVLGVVLAYGLNEWRQARREAERADMALVIVHEELASNRDAVRSSLAYHEEILAALTSARSAGRSADVRTFHRGFISPATLQRTAWDTALQTGALDPVAYSTLLELSRIYAQQERYRQQSQTAGELIYRELFESGSASLLSPERNLVSLVQTFRFRELELVATYDGYRHAQESGIVAAAP